VQFLAIFGYKFNHVRLGENAFKRRPGFGETLLSRRVNKKQIFTIKTVSLSAQHSDFKTKNVTGAGPMN
jgi:hypothetical protein